MLLKIDPKKVLTSMLAIAIVIIGGYELKAQAPAIGTFNNDGGDYTVGNEGTREARKGGIIRMRGNASATGGTETAPGTIEGLGTTNPIPGTVIWVGDGRQRVQPLRYTNLGVAVPSYTNKGNNPFNFARDFMAETGVGVGHYYVSGDFQRYGNTLRATPIADAIAETIFAGTGPSGSVLPFINHICNSHFHYNGSTQQIVLGTSEIITTASSSQFPTNRDNYYNYLYVDGTAGAKLVHQTFTQILEQTGSLQISITNPLHIALLEGCDATKGDTTTIIDIEVVCENPTDCNEPCDGKDCDPCEIPIYVALTAGADVVIEIAGAINLPSNWGNNAPLPFCFFAGDDCITGSNVPEPTRVIYRNGAAGVYPAHYGILEIPSGRNEIALIGNVFIKGKREYALDHRSANNLLTGDFGITFTDACAAPTYAACGETVGWIYRTESANRAYKYHNNLTQLTLGGNTYPIADSFGLRSIPDYAVGTGPLSYAQSAGDNGDYAYIQRLWEVHFSRANSASLSQITSMDLGHKASEIPAGAGGLQGANWATVRGYEAFRNPENTTQLLVGENSSVWTQAGTDISTMPSHPTGDPTCGFFAMSQSQPIILTDSDVPGATGQELTDLSPRGSQIAFGNVPIIIQSVMNGRWSNPQTWGGMTPLKDDTVLIRHWVYTGVYTQDNADVFGRPAFSRNEHDLPGIGIELKQGVTNPQQGDTISVKLAEYVKILSHSEIVSSNATNLNVNATNSENMAALIVGNHEVGGKAGANQQEWDRDPEGTAMNFDIILSFGNVENNNNSAAQWPSGADLSITNITTGASNLELSGVYLMGGDGTSQTNAIPITNFYSLWSKGRFKNDAILDLGK